jgi:death-on-curing protein
MPELDPDGFVYLTPDDVLDLHEAVLTNDPDAEPGVRNEGAIEYALDAVRSGRFGEKPETVHEKAFQLLRLVVANHPFVDGNKRTALATTAVFYPP